ncbi:MAG: signal peptidase I [Ruminococcaceae bacterium]|nr:signal peptidase I [Oscillospiraceae bacterium]
MENKVEKTDLLKTVFEWVELVAFSVACVIIVLNCFARYSPVDGDSMNQTLINGDVLILSNLFYEPDVGDIVVFANERTTYKKPYVKRVIATEGQHLVIDREAKTVTVDGEVSECEEFAFYDPTKQIVDIYWPDIDITVPEGHIFVMGDNRYNSTDSRMIGCVDTRDIIGKVVFRLLPFESMGKVK